MKGIFRYDMDPEDMGIRITSENVFSCPMHSHTYYELLLYEPFCGKSTVNGKTYDVNEMTALLLTPSDIHRTNCSANSTSKFIKIAFSPDCITFAKLPSSAVLYRITDENKFAISVFEEIYQKRQNIPYVKILLNTLLHSLESGKIKADITHKNKHAFVAKAKQIIDSSIGDTISLEAVAEQICISPQYLSKIFPEIMEVNFRDYVTNRRLDHALTLLQNPSLSIIHISQVCGFNDVSYFTKKFKARYGSSPGKYKNFNQGNAK